MTRKRKKLLLDQQEFVTTVVKAKKVSARKRKAALRHLNRPFISVILGLDLFFSLTEIIIIVYLTQSHCFRASEEFEL